MVPWKKPDVVNLSGVIPVNYACTCGLLKPYSRVYFCRYCFRIRCGFCVCHEIDSIYCPNCLENMPSTEARLRKNKCSNCSDCPSCGHTLSTRAVAAAPRSQSQDLKVPRGQEAKNSPRKVFYSVCLSCRWTARDVGLPDQAVASGGLPERENVHTNRITAIQDMYKAVVLWEKHEKQNKQPKKYPQKGKYATLTDKIGLTAAMLRKRIGLPEIISGTKPMIKSVEPSQAKEDVDELPDDIFTNEINLNEITTIQQRLMQPDWQPVTVDKLFPVKKPLLVKRSQRCRTCEHNVCKPEYNPNSTKYKIQLLARYHIPDVRLVTCEPLRAGKPAEMIVKLCNPTQHQTAVIFLPLPNEEEAIEELNILIKEDLAVNTFEESKKKEETSRFSGALASLTKQASVKEPPRLVTKEVNGNVDIPDGAITLSPRDDAAEYDDAGDSQNFQDDPKVVLWRKFNKVAVKLVVIPHETLKIGDNVTVGFSVQHTYVSPTTTLENKEPRKDEHKFKVYIDLGKVVGAE